MPQAVWIGLCQTLSAVFPGTSRSMSTIAAGQMVGPGPARGARVQFSALHSYHDRCHGLGPGEGVSYHEAAANGGVAAAHVVMNPERWIVLLIGTVVSFIVALGVVEWFLMWVRKHGFTVFAIYRILLGVALLIWGAKYLGA